MHCLVRAGSSPAGSTNKGYIMGKHIKTQMDYDMIEKFAREIKRLDPENEVLKQYASMDNFEGSELRKCLKD